MGNCSSHSHCIEDAMQAAENICLANNLSFTDLRQKVLRMIWASHEPAKAYDLLKNLKGDNEVAKPPTIYRTLDFLLDNGLIHKLNSLNAYVGCSHPHKHSECYFLICTKCGEARECCHEDLSKTISRITKKNNFSAKRTTLEIAGICKDCSSK